MGLGSRQKIGALAFCAGLCVLFAALSWTAVRGKSATWDEPSHAATGWLMLWRHDYRLSPDVPPLWKYWIALASAPSALQVDAASPEYRGLKAKDDLFTWCWRVLYHTPGNDAVALVNRSRAMSLALGVLLAIVLGRWAWELGGPVAAASAMFLYCLDPDFLGHAPLVKNDVPFALLYFAAAYAIWRLGRRLTWAAAAILLTAAAVATKLSGVLLGPVMAIVLLARVALPLPWPIFGQPVSSRGRKLLAAASVCVATAVITYIGLWACYDFRFNAGPDGLQSDTDFFVQTVHLQQVSLRLGHTATPAEFAAADWRPPLSTRIVVYLDHHHLLPQAWTAGFVITQFGDQNRAAFLCDQHYHGGRWYYFPLAAAFKLPLGTLAAGLGAAIAGIVAIRKGLFRDPAARWTAIALAVPATIYAIVILTANLNIGLRHAFPLFPLAYLAIGLAAKFAWERGGKKVLFILAIAIAGETAAAYPNYIAFFNSAAVSHRLSLLADSNLDWGQDLPLLADWQTQHPDDILYLDYFGLCDPAAYGIRYVNVPPGYLFGPPRQIPSRPGYLAISATALQQVYEPHPLAVFLQGRQPEAILGGTIYIFRITEADVARPSGG